MLQEFLDETPTRTRRNAVSQVVVSPPYLIPSRVAVVFNRFNRGSRVYVTTLARANNIRRMLSHCEHESDKQGYTTYQSEFGVKFRCSFCHGILKDTVNFGEYLRMRSDSDTILCADCCGLQPAIE